MARSNRIDEAFEAVLLFHSKSPWDAAKQQRWAELSGGQECTAKVLCDMVRAAKTEALGLAMSNAIAFFAHLKRVNEWLIQSDTLTTDQLIVAGRTNKRIDHLIAGAKGAAILDEIDEILPKDHGARDAFARLNDDFREAFR